MNEVRVRFAPSPTGIPHIGNTRTALFNYLFAKKNKGKFILRIEDTDRERLVPESLPKILEILKFLGISWDEGPEIGGPYGPYIQSQRLNIYKEYAEKLVSLGKAYYCFCSEKRLNKMRQEQQKRGKIPRYDRLCRNLSLNEAEKRVKNGEKFVIRLKVPDGEIISWDDLIQGKIKFSTDVIDDQILLKSDGYPTYHLAVTVDDYLMKITHILRGAEWISSTPKHLLIYRAFGWEVPKIGHFPLILGSDKTKLSKRHGAKSCLDYRDEGYLPEALINFMVFLGWSPKTQQEVFTVDDLIKAFDISGIQKQNAIFNLEKLKWFNSIHIKQTPDDKLFDYLKPFLQKNANKEMVMKIIPLVKGRMTTLSQWKNLTDFFFTEPLVSKKSFSILGLNPKEIKLFLTKVIAIFEKAKKLDIQTIKPLLPTLSTESKKVSVKPYFQIIHLAITGNLVTPPLNESMEILGKNVVISRLKKAVSLF